MRRRYRFLRHGSGHRVLFTTFWAALWILASANAEAGEFGTRCQRVFDSNWQVTIDYAYVRCGGFNARMDDNNTKLFYFNMSGGSGFSFNDHLVGAGGVDTVDVFYETTHGGLTDFDTKASLALKAVSTSTNSNQWRFGDDSNQVAIFSQYSCKTLQIDTLAFNRWIGAFKGGVYLVTGSHDKVWDGWPTDDTGTDYADGLTQGKTVKWAWFDGNWDSDVDQDVAIYASSAGALATCQNRRDTMTGQNINGFARLRDGNVNRICASWITDF